MKNKRSAVPAVTVAYQARRMVSKIGGREAQHRITDTLSGILHHCRTEFIEVTLRD